MPVVKVLLITIVLVFLGGLSLVVLGWAMQHLIGGIVGVVVIGACTCQRGCAVAQAHHDFVARQVTAGNYPSRRRATSGVSAMLPPF